MRSRWVLWTILACGIVLFGVGILKNFSRRGSYSQVSYRIATSQPVAKKKSVVSRRYRSQMRVISLHLDVPLAIELRPKEKLVVCVDRPASFSLAKASEPARLIGVNAFKMKRVYPKGYLKFPTQCFQLVNPYQKRVSLLVSPFYEEQPARF